MNVDTVAALANIFALLIPEAILGGAACLLFLGATFGGSRHLWAGISLLGIIGAGIALGFGPHGQATEGEALYASALTLDNLAILIKWVALAGGVVLVLFSWNEVPDRHAAEYQGCLLLIVAGLSLTGAANDLVTLFLALELISIPTYVLLYLPRYDQPAQEAALKYFLLSVFSSALLLFGFSYLYGLGGSTSLPAIFTLLGETPESALPGIAQVALIMILAGLGFKITAVPFHFYAPDVYQGTPTPNAALLAFVPKVAGFVGLIRVLGFVWAGHTGTGLELGVEVPMFLYILSVFTMFLGNLLALLQDNLKRLLAYSSVAHAGYMLIGLSIASDLKAEGMTGGLDAVLFYLVAYGAMTVGAFAVLAYLSTPRRRVEMIEDLAGLSQSHRGVALLMALFLFSLIGLPFTGGFWGKFLLFFGALDAPAPTSHPWLFRVLALLGVVNAAIGAWYYLRIVAVMYLRNPVKPLDRTRSLPGLATLWACAAVTLALGFYPNMLSTITRQAVLPLSPSTLASHPRTLVTADRAGKP